LKNCSKALPPHGKVIVVNGILPDSSVFEARDSLAFQFDVCIMESFGSNARGRTECKVRKLALDAGFQQLNVICEVEHLTITELRKS